MRPVQRRGDPAPSDIKLLYGRRYRGAGQLQGNVLRALWPTLAPGGRLLYVTCSVLAAENDEVVDAFLEANGDARDDVLQNNNIRDLMRRKACGYQVSAGYGRSGRLLIRHVC